MDTEELDVIVVGGGVSGLYAAYNLQNKWKGVKIKVLEAKDRVGGRTCTVPVQGATKVRYWDLGGQWIGRCQPRVMKLLEELDIPIKEQFTTGTKVLKLPNRNRIQYNSKFPFISITSLVDLGIMLERLRWTKNRMDQNAEMLDRETADSLVSRISYTEVTRELFTIAHHTIFGIDPSQASALYFLKYIAAAGEFETLFEMTEGSAQQFRVMDGAQQISNKLRVAVGTRLVEMSSPVVRIVQSGDSAAVFTADRCYRASRVIIAVPPTQQAKIDFDPSLPARKRFTINRMPVGHLIKFVVTYRTAFWRMKGFSGEIACLAPDGDFSNPLNIVIDASYDDEDEHERGDVARGNPALLGFIAVGQAIYWSEKSVEERRDAVLRSLAGFLGEEALDYVSYIDKDWSKEPYNGGCPVHACASGIALQGLPALRASFVNLHFAGTEAATRWCGFIEGAIESGHRASLEVLNALRPKCLDADDLKNIDMYRNHDVIKDKPISRLWMMTKKMLFFGACCTLGMVGWKRFSFNK